MDPDYIYYYVHWTRLILTGILPMMVMTIINIFIFVLIRKQSLERARRMSIAKPSAETRK